MEWDQIHAVLPKAEWETLFDSDGFSVYEGYTLNHKAFGAGRAYFKNGHPCMEGIFGIKGLLSGKVFYPNGFIKFEGVFRLNQGYGPNYPEYGAWYDSDGRLLYRGKFSVIRSSLGWPSICKPEGFGSVPSCAELKGRTFLWSDAKLLMNKEIAD